MDQYVFLYVGKGEGWSRFKIEVSKIGLHRYPLNGKYYYPCQQLPASCPPVLLTQAHSPALYSPCLTPCLLHALVCPAGDSCLLSCFSCLLPALAGSHLPASACTFTAGKHCTEAPSSHHEFPCSLKWEFLAFLPRPLLGLRAQTLHTNRSAPYTLCIANCLISFSQTAN